MIQPSPKSIMEKPCSDAIFSSMMSWYEHTGRYPCGEACTGIGRPDCRDNHRKGQETSVGINGALLWYSGCFGMPAWSAGVIVQRLNDDAYILTLYMRSPKMGSGLSL